MPQAVQISYFDKVAQKLVMTTVPADEIRVRWSETDTLPELLVEITPSHTRLYAIGVGDNEQVVCGRDLLGTLDHAERNRNA